MKIPLSLPLATLVVLACTAPCFADEENNEKSETTTSSKSVSVTVRASSQDDGSNKKEEKVSGRIVIIGPDGQRKEYELGENMPKEFRIGQDLKGVEAHVLRLHNGDEASQEPRFMIGVMCEPADELLRSHLKLGEQGLVVTNLSDAMPAAKAGIQKGDILLNVGEKSLSSVDDLLNAVGASEGKELAVQLLRKGERSSVSVTPSLSTDKAAVHALSELLLEEANVFTDDHEVDVEILARRIAEAAGKGNAERKLILRSIGPGIRVGKGDDFGKTDGFRIRKFVDGARAGTDDVFEFKVKDDEASANSSVKQLRQELVKLRKRLATIEKKLESGHDESGHDENKTE